MERLLTRGTTPAGAGLTTELPGPLTVGGRGLPLIAALADTAVFVDGHSGHVLIRMSKHFHAVQLSVSR